MGRAVIQLVAVQLPVKPGRPNVSSAKSFFVGQREPWILVWGCSLVWFGLGDAFVEWLLASESLGRRQESPHKLTSN